MTGPCDDVFERQFWILPHATFCRSTFGTIESAKYAKAGFVSLFVTKRCGQTLFDNWALYTYILGELLVLFGIVEEYIRVGLTTDRVVFPFILPGVC